MFEVVHALLDWYDGPRLGVADYQGEPHLFQSAWNDGADMETDLFFLKPVDRETFAMVLEDWAIFLRWDAAFRQGQTPEETHPALPEERARHEELERLLEGRLTVDPTQAIRKRAKFRVRNDPGWSGYGCRPLEVLWKEPV